jgi:hypothetical protein
MLISDSLLLCFSSQWHQASASKWASAPKSSYLARPVIWEAILDVWEHLHANPVLLSWNRSLRCSLTCLSTHNYRCPVISHLTLNNILYGVVKKEGKKFYGRRNTIGLVLLYWGRAARDAVESNQKQTRKQYKLLHKFRQGASVWESGDTLHASA